PLFGNLAGKWRYRVGDYRIICEIEDEHLVVVIVKIGHRREVYP
ncbi:MAG: type II toxin-antitoxin system RelE family toxin, partial [Geminicoccaceae bacterium]